MLQRRAALHFRPFCADNRAVGFSVYVHADANGTPLYVGKTGRGRRRDEEHGGEKFWWPRVAVTYRIHVPTERLLCGVEGFLIDAYRSLRTFNQRRGDRGYVTQSEAAHWLMHNPDGTPYWPRLPHPDLLDGRWQYLRKIREKDALTRTWFHNQELWQEWRSKLDTDWARIKREKKAAERAEMNRLLQWVNESMNQPRKKS